MAYRAGLRFLPGADAGLQIEADAASFADLSDPPPHTDVLVVTGESLSDPGLDEIVDFFGGRAALLLLSEDREVTQEGLRLLPSLPLRAWGLLSADASVEEMTAAIQALNEGLVVASPALIEPSLGHAFPVQTSGEAAQVEALTERESQVMQFLAQGLANKQIAAMLGISEHTVKFHVSSIYSRLGATNRTEAVRLALQLGLVSI